MILGSTTTRVEIYAVNMKSLDQKFELETEVSKVDKPELMKLSNPNYAHLSDKYKHLNGVKFEDPDTHAQIPVHLVLGVSDYAKIKTTAALRWGDQVSQWLRKPSRDGRCCPQARRGKAPSC